MRTLILGLGNPIRGDDGVGIKIAEALESEIHHPEVEVAESISGGLDLLDLLAGYQRAIIIDAIQTHQGKPGQVYRLGLENLPVPLHCSVVHDVDLVTALDLGRRLGMAMPQEIVIFAIEVADVTTFGEECTPEVERAIPEVIRLVLQELPTTDQS